MTDRPSPSSSAEQLTPEQLQHLARLARLELTSEEQQAMQADLNKVLSYFEQLSGVDTAGVEEMQRPIDLVNVLREDVPGSVFPVETVQALAPDWQDGFIRVPRTIE